MLDDEATSGHSAGLPTGNAGKPRSDETGPATDQKVGSFILVEKLGAGGVGEVWKARDRRLNRVVALKFLLSERPGSSPPGDLLREARAASALNHPNIVTVFEVGESAGSVYLAMEFVEGETLRACLKRAPVPLDEALDIATQVATGLAIAHRHGIVHRDLKPENIMVRVDGLVKLMDFGLAKVLPWGEKGTADSSLAAKSTESGQLTGTITYMSPEQARGLRLTPATDVFSFGIVLYEMLTGEHPFRAETPMDTLSAILAKEPPRVHTRCPAVPPEVSDICVRALEKDASRRYPSAVELAEELKQAESALAAAPATPPPIVRSKPRWMKAIGTALIALLISVGVWQYRAPSTERVVPRVQSVAVMALRAATGDATASVLARELPEELTAALAKTGLLVASQSSVAELGQVSGPRAVGAQLGVDAVLEGTVRGFGGKFKVRLELVSTRTGFQIWSETFTVEGAEVVGGTEKTAAEIAHGLRQALAGP